VERSKTENIWAGVVRNSLSDEEVQLYFDIAEECRRSAARLSIGQ
jgi:hypothetical protein